MQLPSASWIKDLQLHDRGALSRGACVSALHEIGRQTFLVSQRKSNSHASSDMDTRRLRVPSRASHCSTDPAVTPPQVTNHPELHRYAAQQTLEALKRGANHDAMVGAAAAIVGASLGPKPARATLASVWRLAGVSQQKLQGPGVAYALGVVYGLRWQGQSASPFGGNPHMQTRD